MPTEIIARQSGDDGDNWGECSRCGGIVWGSPIGKTTKQCECRPLGTEVEEAGKLTGMCLNDLSGGFKKGRIKKGGQRSPLE